MEEGEGGKIRHDVRTGQSGKLLSFIVDLYQHVLDIIRVLQIFPEDDGKKTNDSVTVSERRKKNKKRRRGVL